MMRTFLLACTLAMVLTVGSAEIIEDWKAPNPIELVPWSQYCIMLSNVAVIMASNKMNGIPKDQAIREGKVSVGHTVYWDHILEIFEVLYHPSIVMHNRYDVNRFGDLVEEVCSKSVWT